MSVTADRSAIEAATANLLDAVNSADVSRVMSVWSEDGILMPPHHAAVHGRSAIESYFRELFERSRFKFVFTASAISIDGNTAIERVSYTAEAWRDGSKTPVADRGKGLHVYKREAGGTWKLAIDVWNTDIPPTS
jgi:uncharacterized protein (TIGR02246 family)